MATTSTDLFNLIKSMSPTEKAYFKKYGFRRGAEQTEYFKLFDAIDKQKNYEEDKLISKFSFKSFATAKNHLYRLVLRALTEFNSGKTNEDQILQLTREMLLLAERGLDDQSRKKIKAAKTLIKNADLPMYGLPLFITELSLIPYHEDFHEEKQQLLSEEKETIELLSGYSDYRKLYEQMTYLVGKWGVIVRNPAHVKEIEEFLSQELLQDNKTALFFTSKYMFHAIHKILNQCLCKYEQALKHSANTLHLFEEYPEYKVRKPAYYSIALNNMLIDLIGLGMVDEFDKLALETEEFNKTLSSGYRTKEGVGNLQVKRLYRDLVAGDFQVGLLRTQKMQSERFDFPYQPHMVVQQEYLMASTYFYNAHFEQAQVMVLGLLGKPEIGDYREYHLFTLVLNLLLHLEMDNRELLQQARDSTYRFLSRTDNLYAIEKLLLTFLKSLQRIPDDAEELKAAFTKLRTAVEPLIEDDFEHNAFSYFHFLPWLDARIEGISFLQAAKNRGLKR